jgi:hypothetical protein
MKDHIKHTARLYILQGEPKPGMYDFMLDRKVADLARLWAVLDGRFTNERPDTNATLIADVGCWNTLTIRELSKGFEFSADPIIVAAVEEAVRRALKMLFTMGDYAARYAKQKENFELGTAEAEPTGLAAVRPDEGKE